MQALRRITAKVSSCHKGLYCVSYCVRVQKEAGILERGMQALRSTISSLLGQTGGTKPEDKVWPHLLSCNPYVQLHSPPHAVLMMTSMGPGAAIFMFSCS